MSERPNLCLDKDCSTCCNPVKVRLDFPEDKIPVDENGKKIWVRRNEIYIPEHETEKVRLETFDCLKYDIKTGKCTFYEKRPAICRNTSCVRDESPESVDKQHQKAINEKYIIIKKESSK